MEITRFLIGFVKIAYDRVISYNLILMVEELKYLVAQKSLNQDLDGLNEYYKNILCVESFHNENTSSLFHDIAYFKSCYWSPDDLCLLASDSSNQISLFNLPSSIFGETIDKFKPCFIIKEGENIYDMAWYPLMNSYEPSTCCFASSTKDHPVHLWDAFYGTLRCSYVMHNHLDESVSPIGIEFSKDGKNLFCGSKNKIYIFDTVYYNSGPIDILNTNDYNKQLSGIFSCFSFTELDDSYGNAKICAAGSYDKSVALFDFGSNSLTHVIDLKNEEKQLRTFDSRLTIGGVTQVEFKKNKLYVGSRNSSTIINFDIRNLNSIYSIYERHVDTQQKLSFCFDDNREIMISGDTSGNINFWTTSSGKESCFNFEKPTYTYKIDDFPLPGCDFNKSYNLLASASGCRTHQIPMINDYDIDSPSPFSLKIFKLVQ